MQMKVFPAEKNSHFPPPSHVPLQVQSLVATVHRKFHDKFHAKNPFATEEEEAIRVR